MSGREDSSTWPQASGPRTCAHRCGAQHDVRLFADVHDKSFAIQADDRVEKRIEKRHVSFIFRRRLWPSIAEDFTVFPSPSIDFSALVLVSRIPSARSCSFGPFDMVRQDFDESNRIIRLIE